jgi:fimbrial chaperone protein
VFVCAERPGLPGLITVTFVLAVIMAFPVQAANFGVSPVNVTLANGQGSQLIAITNRGSEPLSFQVNAYRWEQRSDGQMLQAPTEDVIFFPQLFEVQPHETQNLRVGVAAPAGMSERTYRLLIRQLKPFEGPPSAKRPDQSTIVVLTNLSIPVFVEPLAPAAHPAISGIALKNGMLSFTISNSGNVHFRITALDLNGFGAGLQPTFSKRLSGGYVLAHGSRTYHALVSKTECKGINRLSLSMATEQGKLRSEVPINAADCVVK